MLPSTHHASKKTVKALSVIAAILILSGGFTATFSLFTDHTLALHSQCSDGIDNDHDEKVDYPQDNDCESLDDDFEGLGISGNFVTVTDDHETVSPGGAIVYRITLKQQRQDVRIVNLSLHLPHQSNITSASDGGAVSTDIVRWTNVSVYKNVTRVLTVNVNVSPDVALGQYLVARVLVEGAEATDTTLVQEYAQPVADQYAVSVSDGKEFILPGEQTTYTVRVRNQSALSQRKNVNLALPYESYFIAASEGGIRESFNVTWKDVSFAPNEEKSFNATIQIDPRAKDRVIIRAKAYVGSIIGLDQTVIRIGLPYNAISTTITDNRTTAEIGQILRYTVQVTNNSDVVATSVPVDASFPIYGEFVDATEGGKWDGSNVRWLVLQIAPRATRTLSYSVRVRPDAPMNAMLTASVYSEGSTSRDTTKIVEESMETGLVSPVVMFRKTSDRGEAVPGGKIRYTLFIRNTLDHVISDASIVDRFDSRYLSLDSFENPGNLVSSSDHEMVWSIPVLQIGESWQTSYVLSVDPLAPNGVELDNVATLRGVDFDGLSLTEKVRTNKAGVIRDFPTTGAGIDAILGLVLAGVAVASSAAQRKFGLARLLSL